MYKTAFHPATTREWSLLSSKSADGHFIAAICRLLDHSKSFSHFPVSPERRPYVQISTLPCLPQNILSFYAIHNTTSLRCEYQQSFQATR